jgi:chitodextrinase
MTALRTPVDICNKALSVLRQPAIFSFADNTVQAVECNRVYDALRLAELRRALWVFSTRRVVLRAIDTTTLLLTAPAWATGTAYIAGDIVTYNNQLWVAMTSTTGNEPDIVPASGTLIWDSYFGPVTVDLFDDTVSYFDGELVYKTPNDGTYTVYRSLVNANANDPAGVDPWDSKVIYNSGQVVSFGGTNYQSRINLNHNNEPDTSPTQWTTTITSPLVSNSWRVITSAVLTPLNINYPLGAGPAADTHTLNAFRLPAGFLRPAPGNPKARVNPYLGSPPGNLTRDWLYEGNYIVSWDAKPLMLRFVADIQTVPEMDSLFQIGLAHRLAIELAPRLADAEHFVSIISDAREEYARTITEARTIDGIERGPIDPVEDDFIVARY